MSAKMKYMTIWQAIMAMIVMVIGGIVLGGIMFIFTLIFPAIESTVTESVAYFGMMMSVVLYLYYIRKKACKEDAEFKESISNCTGRLKFYYVLLGLILFQLANILLEPLMLIVSEEYFQEYYDLFMNGNKVSLLFTGIILAPILEEIIFRGYLLRGLENKYGAVKAVLYVSILFAVIHFSLIQSPSAFLGSIIISLIFLMSKYSLSTVILLHFLNNLLAYSQLYFFGVPDPHTHALRGFVANDTIYAVLYCLVLIGFILIIICGFKYMKTNKGVK